MIAGTQSAVTDFLTLRNGHMTVRVSPKGGALVDGTTSDGRQFLRSYEKAMRDFTVSQAACFPLVPIGNRVAGNEFHFAGKRRVLAPNTGESLYIHGDGWLGQWDVLEASPATVTLAFDKRATENSPYEYRAGQSLRLSGPRLDLGLSVENCGNETLPFGIGFHPFFPRTPKTTLWASASSWWTEDQSHLPQSRQQLPEAMDFSIAKPIPAHWINNAFEGWDGTARIDWPEQGLSLRIEATDIFSRFMLFAPRLDRSFFCLEPMSHTPNALAHVETDPKGLLLLAPGEKLDGALSLTIVEGSKAQ